jgi:ribokinase
MDNPPRIHGFGSLNMDLVCQTQRLPAPGETVLGHGFTTVPGGKGANQAVAAARLGARTRMVGRVGDDAFGQTLIQALHKVQVNTDSVVIDPTAPTGVATIVVDQKGNNQIVVVPGSNGQVDDTDVERLRAQFQPGDWLLLQFEIPLGAVVAAATAARAQGVKVMVDPAPARSDWPPDFLSTIDVITPNQTEASQLVGWPVNSLDTARQAAQTLVKQGVAVAIVKLGEQGVVVASQDGWFHQPAIPVAVVDTVAAGDAFNGGLAVALGEGQSLPDACAFACRVAACSVMVQGAQASMPSREQALALPLP